MAGPRGSGLGSVLGSGKSSSVSLGFTSCKNPKSSVLFPTFYYNHLCNSIYVQTSSGRADNIQILQEVLLLNEGFGGYLLSASRCSQTGVM